MAEFAVIHHVRGLEEKKSDKKKKANRKI